MMESEKELIKERDQWIREAFHIKKVKKSTLRRQFSFLSDNEFESILAKKE